MERISRRRVVMMGLLAGSGTLGMGAKAGKSAERSRPTNVTATAFTMTLRSGEIARLGKTHVLAGSVESSLGPGALALNLTRDPRVADCGATIAARWYLLGGSLTFRAVVTTSAVLPDGTVSLTGMGAILKGAGKFEGARGRFQIKGQRPAKSTQATITITGQLAS